MTAAVQLPRLDTPPPGPLFLCADSDEAELLCSRGCDAITSASIKPENYYKFRARHVIVTPRAHERPSSGPAQLHAMSCRVEAMQPGVDLARDDLLAAEREPMFRKVDANVLAALSGGLQVSARVAATPQEHPSTIVVRRMSDIEAKPISWLWPGRIARGKVSMIAGHPGLGKSQVTAALAAVVTTGGKWPVDRTACDRGSVILLNAEDDAADTIRPRLEAAGADVTRIEIIEAVADGYHADGSENRRGFNLKADLGALDTLLAARRDVALVVIDPVSAYLSGVETHVNADVRAVLAPLGELAARHGVAIVCVSHLNKAGANKPGAGDALLRVSGSLAFVAAARAAYIVVRDAENNARRLLLPAKNNVGKDQAGLAFSVESYQLPGGIETSRVLWEPEPVTVTADEAMAAPATDEDRTMTDEAVAFLRAALSGGARLLGREIKRDAIDAGISDKALRSARIRLGIKPESEGFGKDRGTYWRLPISAAPAPTGAYVPSTPINALLENRAHMDSEGTYGNAGDTNPTDLERF